MSNPIRGEATLVAGDQSYRLVYDINAFCAAQEATDLDVDVLLEEMERGKRLPIVRALLWAGLSRHHPCSMIEAGGIMSVAGTKPTAIAVRAGIASAFPQPTEDSGDTAGHPPKPADGTSSAG